MPAVTVSTSAATASASLAIVENQQHALRGESDRRTSAVTSPAPHPIARARRRHEARHRRAASSIHQMPSG
jgi:hypothetical protein